MQKIPHRFWLALFNPEISIRRYIVGTILLTLFVQLIYDLLQEYFSWAGTAAAILGLLFVLILFFFRDFLLSRRHLVPTESRIEPQKGLILLISPGNHDLPIWAVEHHLPALKHCWLIASPASAEMARTLQREISDQWPEVVVHLNTDEETGLVDPEDARSTWDRVDAVYRRAESSGLEESEIVSDITGGQKPMSVGMAFACGSAPRKMQYMKAFYDPSTGRIDRSRKAVPIQIAIAHMPK